MCSSRNRVQLTISSVGWTLIAGRTNKHVKTDYHPFIGFITEDNGAGQMCTRQPAVNPKGRNEKKKKKENYLTTIY